jgi:hypothetical protein
MAKSRRSETEIKKTTVGRPGGNINVGRGAMKVKAAGKKNSVAKPGPVVMAPKSHKKMSEIEKAAKTAASPFKTGVALARASAAAKKPKG